MLKGIKEIITLGANEMMVKNHIWSLEVDRPNDLLYAGLHDGLIKVFNMIDNKKKCKRPSVTADEFQAHKGIVYTMVLAPCRTKLFTAGLDQQIKFWDLETKTELYRLEGHSNVVYTLRLDHEKGILFSGSEDGTIRKWDVKSKKLLQIVNGLNSALSSLIVGRTDTLISVDSEKREIIRIYNSSHKEFVGRFDGHKDEVFALEMTSDGRRIFSAGNDRSIKIWDFETRRIVKSVLAHSKCINCLLLTDNNRFLFSCSDDCFVKIWTVHEHDLIIFAGINHGCQVLTIKLSRDNRLLFSGGKSSKPVKTWDVESLQKAHAEGQGGPVAADQEPIPQKTEHVHEKPDDDTLEQRSTGDKAKFAAKAKKFSFREPKESLSDERVISCRSKTSERGDSERELITNLEDILDARPKDKAGLHESVVIDERGKGWKKLPSKIKVVPVGLEEPVMVDGGGGYFGSRKREESKLKKDLAKYSNEAENLIIREKTDNRYKGSIVIGLCAKTADVLHKYLPAMRGFLAKAGAEKQPAEPWQRCVSLLEAYIRMKTSKKPKKNEIELVKSERFYKVDKENLLIVLKALVSNFSGSLRHVNDEILLYDKKSRKSASKAAKRKSESVAVIYNLNPEHGQKRFTDAQAEFGKHDKPRKKPDKRASGVKELVRLKDQLEPVEAASLVGGDIQIVSQKGQARKGQKAAGAAVDIEKMGLSATVKVSEYARPGTEPKADCFMYKVEAEDKNHFEELAVMQKMLGGMQTGLLRMKSHLAREKLLKAKDRRVLEFLKKRRQVLEWREHRMQMRSLRQALRETRDSRSIRDLQGDLEKKERLRLSLEQQMKGLEGEIGELRGECAEFKKQLLEKTEQITRMKQHANGNREESESAMKGLSAELESVRARNEALTEENKELKESKGGSRMETSCFEDFIGFLKKENATLKEEYGSIKRKYETLKEENRSAMYNNKLFQFERAKLEQEKALLKDKLDQMRDKYTKLQNGSGLGAGVISEANSLSGKGLIAETPEQSGPEIKVVAASDELLGKREHDALKADEKVPIVLTSTRFLGSLSGEEKELKSPEQKRSKRVGPSNERAEGESQTVLKLGGSEERKDAENKAKEQVIIATD